MWVVIPLVSFLLFTVLGIIVFRQDRTRLNRTFAIFLIASGVWSFTSFMLHLNPFPNYAIVWNEILVAAMVWTSVSYYHFVRVYNNKPDNIGIYLGYGAIFTILGLGLTGHIVNYAYVVDGILFHDLGTALYIVGVIPAIFLILAVLGLVRRHHKSIDPVDRNRTAYLVIGSVIVAVTSYITNLTPSIAGLSIDHIGNMVNASIIAYVITVYQLLDVRFVTRKLLAYTLLITHIIGIYLGLMLLGQRLIPAQPTYLQIIYNVCMVIVIALLSRPWLHKLEDFIYRSFHWGTYRYRRALIEFGERMSNVINLDELAGEMLTTITKALDLKQGKLLFQDFNEGSYATKYVFPNNQSDLNDELSLNADNPIIGWLHKNNTPLYLESINTRPEFKGLWVMEKEQLAEAKLALLCPIKSRGRLIGIIALGHKKSKPLFSHEDLEMVMSMATQAAAIIENAQLYSQAINKANTDGLTGLFNHRHFHERIDHEIARGSRFGTTFSLIMLDIDLFKAYNDIHGHLAGDEILRRVAFCIKTSIRGLDIAFRYGGEEFTIILPETRLDDSFKVAERIRKTIASKASSKAPPITASIGVANWPIDGVMKEEIISSADSALYRAKQTGRNRTYLSSDVSKPSTPLVGVELEAQSRALSIIYALAATVDAKDHYTYGHSKKVSDYAVSLGEAMDLPQEKIDIVRAAGLLHDIGKVGVPDSILNKKGKLNDDEWKLIKDHPKLGVEILRHVIDLVNCLPVILHHHERFDGTGYPSGLKGENIPVEARILSIADAFDAITSPRPYRDQLSSQQALEELQRCSGSQFDPEVMEHFTKIIVPPPVRRLKSRSGDKSL